MNSKAERKLEYGVREKGHNDNSITKMFLIKNILTFFPPLCSPILGLFSWLACCNNKPQTDAVIPGINDMKKWFIFLWSNVLTVWSNPNNNG